MRKVYVCIAGNTLGYHKKFVKKVKKRFRAKVVEQPEKSEVTIVFCPIVSRFETDVRSALASVPDSARQKVILVAMHHTFDPNYVLPNQRQLEDSGVTLFVDCLFFENKGLLKCACNKRAVKTVRKELKHKGDKSRARKERKTNKKSK